MFTFRPPLLILLLLIIINIDAYKLLVFSPTISRSHIISNGRIADTLAAAGHEVVLFEPDFLRIIDKVNATKIARRWPVGNFSTELLDFIQSLSGDAFAYDVWYKPFVDVYRYEIAYNQLCKDLINRDDLMSQLRAEKFDAYFGEQVNPCGNAVAHAIGIKVHFWISSCPISEQMSWYTGMPFPFSYVPASIGSDMDSKPTYLERIWNIRNGMSLYIVMEAITRDLNTIFINKFGADFPSIQSIAGNSDIIFVATDEFVDFPRPILPNVIHLGGLEITEKSMEMNEVFSSEMKKGHFGVIYFSFGTQVNTSLLPQIVMKNIIDTALHFPQYHFIIKVDTYDQFAFSYASSIPNVYITSWVPQPAILAHERLRIFITHAGYNGVMEAARAGVPLITMPFMFDQTKNSRAVASSGWGIALKRQYLRDKPELLREAIWEMLNNKRYKEKAVRISNLVRKKPFNATERLVKYTEFVLDNNGIKELLVEGRNINIIKYYNIDIIVPAFILVYVIFTFFIRCFFTFISWISLVKVKKIKLN